MNSVDFLPSSCEHVQSLVQVKVKMSMEMSSYKLMKLVFALGVKVLELVKISLDIQTIWSQDVGFPLHQVLTFYSSDLAAAENVQRR